MKTDIVWNETDDRMRALEVLFDQIMMFWEKSLRIFQNEKEHTYLTAFSPSHCRPENRQRELIWCRQHLVAGTREVHYHFADSVVAAADGDVLRAGRH